MTRDNFDHNVGSDLIVQRIDRIADAVDFGRPKTERMQTRH